jgi:RNA polymerase sigma-B factor
MGRPAHLLRSDRDDVRARAIEEHLPLVEAIARRHAAGGDGLEDLVQAGSIGLIKAVDRFDPHRGTPFAAFAALLIEGEIRHDMRARGRRTASEVATPLATAEAEARDEERAEARLLLERGWPALSDRERRVLALRYFGDLTQAQIAARVGLSQAQVSRLLRRALERLGRELGAGVAGGAPPPYSEAGMATQDDERDERPSHSGRLLVRMPPSLHSELARTAEREGVSLNTLVTNALAGAVAWRQGARGPGTPDARDPAPPKDEPAGRGSPDDPRAGPVAPRPRWLTIALAANLAAVAVAATVGIVLLILALQS